MLYEKRPGPCWDNGRHRWGDAKHYNRKTYALKDMQFCLHCARARVIVYTRSGNHFEYADANDPRFDAARGIT